MAKYVDQSLPQGLHVGRGDQGFTLCVPRFGVPIVCISLLIAISYFSFAPVANADPWLDRVERSLRRIESAAKYTEPAGAGSKLATKAHNACIYKSDKDACAKLIWRSPELLPVRDWAVGTAHIKRGEMREQSGDVAGALEDYRDALGYHQFPNLHARIKRLEKRKKINEQRAAQKSDTNEQKQQLVANTNNASGNEVAPPQKTSVSKVGVTDSKKARHPVVVVAGWAPTLADKNGQPDAGGASTEALQLTGVPESTPSRDVAGSSAPKAAPPSSSQLPTDNNQARVDTVASPPAPVKVERERPPQMSSLAARFVPGRQVVQNSVTTSTTLQPPKTLQFNVNHEIARSLARVRDKTNMVLTTSALPDRSRISSSARQRSFMSLTVMGLLTLMLFSTVALARGWRPAFPTVFPRGERKPVLSVDDLEQLIKTRSADLGVVGRSAQQPRLGHHPKIGPVARPPLPRGFSDAAPPLEAALEKPDEAMQSDVHDPTPVDRNAVEVAEGHGVQQTVDTPSVENSLENDPSQALVVGSLSSTANNQESPVQTKQEFTFERLDASLLRRVSYGAASLVVVGDASAKVCTEQIFGKVDAARRPDLLRRFAGWDVLQANAKGVLNPFALGAADSDDPLVVRQRFNAAFEFYSSIFEGIFGERFVYDQKVILRYLVMLLQTMPNSSLETFYKMLEAPRALEPFHDALLEIDNVSARLFFTTVFSSDEFSKKADYMRTRLAPIIGHELVAHLCCGQPTTDPIGDLTKDGGLVLLALQPDDLSAGQRNVVVRCLLSVLALHSQARTTVNSAEISSSLLLPNAKQQIGGSQTDAEFLLNQVHRAGYNIL